MKNVISSLIKGSQDRPVRESQALRDATKPSKPVLGTVKVSK